MHALNREQEVAAPMIMSHLMGYGQEICSHHYTPLFWASFDFIVRNELCVTGVNSSYRQQSLGFEDDTDMVRRHCTMRLLHSLFNVCDLNR